MKKYFGKSRADNLAWLLNEWLKNGPQVCFLQGFPGLGKSDLARDFGELAEKQLGSDNKRRWQQVVINEISDRPTPSVIESLMDLSVTLSNQGLHEMEQVLLGQTAPSLAFAVEKALQRPVVIVLDEAQRFFRRGSGAPSTELSGILTLLRNRPNLPGRLLLLSDRIVEDARWSEWIPKRILTKLEPDEAIEALDSKLSQADVVADISLERKREVVRDLDFNPRAIEALVGALRYESLDEIIGSNPGLWDVRDREISQDFLKALERDLLERTLYHLGDLQRRKLRQLAVHRRSFKREALEKLCGSPTEADDLRAALVSRYLLNFHKGALSLNPIVREISLSHLRQESAEFKRAHSAAADYHLRHFKGKQIIGGEGKLGESFAEVRYHLVHADRAEELSVIGQRFTDYLKREISAATPVPSDSEELDERIGVLTALLGNGGAKGLEYHLARCLQARAKTGDLQAGIIHAGRAVGPLAPEETWYLLASLTRQVEGGADALEVIRRAVRELATLTAPLYQLGAEILESLSRSDEAVALLKEGIEVIPPTQNLSSLYQICGNLLAKAGRTEEAVALLKEGIKVILPTQSLFSLYQLCGDLLAKSGRIEEAVALLREGIKVIPPTQNLFSLYQICGNLLAKAGRTEEAVALLKEGIKVIPPTQNLFSLYQICGHLLANAGRTEEAVALLKEGIRVISPTQNLFSLYQICGNLLAKVGRTEEAVALLKEGIRVIPPNQGLFSLYQATSEVLCRAGRPVDAMSQLWEGFRVIPRQFNGYKLGEAALYLCAGTQTPIKDELVTEIRLNGNGPTAALGHVLQWQMRNDWVAAANAARAARKEFPRYFLLACMEGFSWLASGDAASALRAIMSFPDFTATSGSSSQWLLTFVNLRRRDQAEAAVTLAKYLGRKIDAPSELNEGFLLRLWDQQEVAEESSSLCFHFPIMPPTLTGLAETVHRWPFQKPVLLGAKMAALPVARPVPPKEVPRTDVYVSYSWGEDSSEAGRRREEIVNRLCSAVEASGRAIGRDKDRMKGGDSIERFAHEISRAERIIAVISEKSLHSEFCMAHELFRAFRRCDYQRQEFQEKVIALVMDDAKPYLKDHLAIVALAKSWSEKLQNLQKELQSIDPNRKSPNLWIFVDMMEEMCPRLPDMLGALSDIVMKRGFDDIAADQFKQVLERLPAL